MFTILCTIMVLVRSYFGRLESSPQNPHLNTTGTG